MRWFIWIAERITGLVGYAGAWILAPLVISMVYEVFARHVFGAPTAWAYEVGYMLAGSSYIFGIAYCLREGGHVRVDFIYEKLPRRWQATIDLVGYLVLLMPGLLWLVWGLGDFAWQAYVSGEVSGVSAWNPVVWPFRTAWLIGFVALALQVAAEIVKAAAVIVDARAAERPA